MKEGQGKKGAWVEPAEPLISDEQLMLRLLDGQEQVLDTLVERYLQPLYSYAYSILHSQSAAEDAFQETFLKVYRKRRSFRRDARFRPWVYQICLNVCRDLLRKQKRQRELPLEEGTVGVDCSPGPQERAEQADQAASLREALRQLPAKQREVLLLAHYQGLNYEEISQVLNIPRGTVKSRHHHAIKKLAELLKKIV